MRLLNFLRGKDNPPRLQESEAVKKLLAIDGSLMAYGNVRELLLTFKNTKGFDLHLDVDPFKSFPDNTHMSAEVTYSGGKVSGAIFKVVD